MKIGVIGLGLIGGSYAASLSNKGHQVYGVDINEDTLAYALEKKWIIKGSKEASDYISDMDIIVIGLYPMLILS